MDREEADLLRQWAHAHGIGISARQMELLDLYLTELVEWNLRMNLTGMSSRRQILRDLLLDSLIALPHLRPCGLMTMAPIVAHPEQARPVFVALRKLRDELSARFSQVGWRELSMGMTDDFEPAIEEGATLVRVGRAIFGDRLK